MDGNPRLCMASAVTGYTSSFGKDEPAGCFEDMDYSDCFFITGSNTLECHPILWERMMDRKRSHPDTTLIVVDPRRTFTGMHADLYLPIYPGTDVALYNSMMNEFIRTTVLLIGTWWRTTFPSRKGSKSGRLRISKNMWPNIRLSAWQKSAELPRGISGRQLLRLLHRRPPYRSGRWD